MGNDRTYFQHLDRWFDWRVVVFGYVIVAVGFWATTEVIDWNARRISLAKIAAVQEAPISDWVVYTKIVPENNTFGDDIDVVSYLKRPLHYDENLQIAWSDILRCDFDDNRVGLQYVKLFKSQALLPPREGPEASAEYASAWTYPAITRVPPAAGDCVIDATITIKIPVEGEWIQKSKTLRSEPFDVTLPE